MSQLENNIIISGQPEQPWEPYKSTKERVINTIATTLSSSNDNSARQEASKVEISYCSRVGRHRIGKPRPISVPFQRKENKKNLLANKRNLPNGIFVKEEFSQHINMIH